MNSEFSIAPLVEGFLHKRKNEKASTLFGSTNKRWFTLDTKTKQFAYAETKQGKAKRQISLENFVAVNEISGIRGKPKGFTHAFMLKTSERNYILFAATSEELDKWLSAFALLLSDQNEPQQPAKVEEKKQEEIRVPFGQSP